MPSPLSVDLRERVVAAVVAGVSCHRAAARFGVSVSSASRWSERFRHEGHVASKPMGGDHTSKRIEAHAALILATSSHEPRLFLREVWYLAAHDVALRWCSAQGALSLTSIPAVSA